MSPRPGCLECRADGLAAIVNDACIARFDAADDGPRDGLRILGARIVVGDDDLIRQFIGNGAHDGTLAGIAIAAAAEHAPQRALAMLAQRRQAPWPERPAYARNRPRPWACRRAACPTTSMRPGGATHSASTRAASASDDAQATADSRCTTRAFSALKRPSSRVPTLASPKLPSTRSEMPCTSKVTCVGVQRRVRPATPNRRRRPKRR